MDVKTLSAWSLALAFGGVACDLSAPAPEPVELPPTAAQPELLSAMVDFGGGPEEIQYTVDEDGMAVFGGDMILGPAELVAAGRVAFTGVDQDPPENENVAYSAISHLNSWPGGRIPYVIDPAAFPAGSAIRTRIQNAISTWNQETVVRLVPRNTSNPFEHYVVFSPATAGMGRREGKASIGFQPLGTQRIYLGDSVSESTIEHEIGHTVGLFHEHQRTDRDNHVTVLWDNIQTGKEGNFHTYVLSGAVGLNFGSYDRRSLMHYGSTTFARRGTVSLINADCAEADTSRGCRFGSGTALTTKDIAGVTRLVTGDPILKFKLRNDASGQCLRPEGASRSAGARVILSNCSNSSSRRWYEWTRPGTNEAMIINDRSRLCLARDSNNRLIQAHCDGSWGQRLEFLSPGWFSSGNLLQRGSRCLRRLTSSSQPSWDSSCGNSSSRRWHKDLL